MLINKHSILFWLALFQCVVAAYAQQPVWLNYTSAEGLPSNEVYHAHQDKRGFIWFCTDGGVSCFDGHTFRNFNSENGFPDNTVLGCYEDQKGNIWFRTLTGKIASINSYTYQIQSIEAQIDDYYINSIFVDSNAVIWAGTSSSQKYFKIFPPYTHNDVIALADSTSLYQLHIQNDGGYIYYKTKIHGNESLGINKAPQRTSLNIKGITTVQRIMYLKNHILLAATNNENWLIGPSQKVSPFKTEQIILSSLIDKEGNLWVSLAYSAGVLMYEGGNTDAQPKKYFQGIGISSILQDTEGSFWFTSTTNGVFHVQSFSLLNFSKEPSDLRNKTTGVYPLKDGSILGRNYDNTYFNIKENSLTDKEPFGLIGLKAVPNIIVHSSSGTTSQSGLRDEIHPEPEVFRMNGTQGYWSVTSRAITRTNENYFIEERFVPKSRINSFCVQDNSIVWLTCLDGLWSFSNNEFKSHSAENELLSRRLDDVKVDPAGTLWICSRSAGVIIKQGEKIYHLTAKNGLASDMCRSILLDGNAVYVGTNRGISKIIWHDWNDYFIENFSLEQGLPSAEISMITKSGDMIWAASDAGIFAFNSANKFVNAKPPIVYVSEMKASDKTIDVNSKIVLEPNQNFIRFTLLGLSFKYPKANSFKYRLLGLDTAWQNTKNHEVVFTTLPAGNYSFEVLAINNSGIASDSPVKIDFKISPPFWSQWWFILFAVFAITALVYFIMRFRIKAIQARAEEKTRLAKDIAQLEMRALRTQMNPHFIFNCMNSIQHSILNNDKLEAQKQLTKFSKLIRNVLENSKQDYIPLQIEIETLELYIQMEALRFQSMFNYTLEVESSIDRFSTMIPPMIIQPFVENSIVHGLLPSKDDQRMLKISIAKKNGHIHITIDDNGIGREEAKRIKNDKDANRKSFGMAITKERLEILQKSRGGSSNISFTVTDKKNENGKAAGTKVELTIPILQS